MNQKGLTVLQTIVEQELSARIAFLCLGRDKNIQNDYSAEIIEVANKAQISIIERTAPLPEYNLGLAIGWRWIINTEIPLLVIHDSILPKFRGFAPLVNMLIKGEPKIGATLLWASPEYDKGNIVNTDSIAITYPIKIIDAIGAILTSYQRLTIKLCQFFKSGTIPDGIPQNESEATYSLWRDSEDYLIDWSEPAETILRTIHACGYPYNGSKTRIDNKKITILDAQIEPDIKIENRTPGKLIFLKDSQPVIVCGSGLLRITEMESDSNPFKLNWFRVRFW